MKRSLTLLAALQLAPLASLHAGELPSPGAYDLHVIRSSRRSIKNG